MDVRDHHIPEDTFSRFLEEMPQVCVELVVDTDDGVLLCKRERKPEYWFWPGSRLYKGESLTDAAHRVATEELGIEVDIEKRLGVQSHFWTADQTEEGVSRHTVNVVFRVSPTDPGDRVTLDAQHSDYRYLAERDPELHEYVREYIETYDLIH